MKNKNIFILAFCLISLCFACKKEVYEGPINSTYEDEFWTSQNGVEQATLGMYSQLRTCMRADASYLVTGDAASGLYYLSDKDWNLGTLSQDDNWNFSYVPYLEGTLKNWSRYYTLIAQANLILKKVPEMADGLFESSQKKDSYISEALFMRAWAYFYLVQTWGDPIYSSDVFAASDYGNLPATPRNTNDEVITNCINDLTTAIKNLDYTDGDVAATIRTNKATAYMLLAYIYAWKQDYANAHAACQAILDNGGYSMQDISTYNMLWNGQVSDENIFEIPMLFNANDPGGAETSQDFFGKFLYFDDVKDPADTAHNYYANGTAWQLRAAPDFNAAWGIDSLFHVTESDEGRTSPDMRFSKIIYYSRDFNAEYPYRLIKYTNFEYKDAQAKSVPHFNNNLVIYRLSDVYLLDAEAQANLGQTSEALQLLKQTEDRAGISYTGSETKVDIVKEIMNERAREFIGEGKLYFDMIRIDRNLRSLGAEGTLSEMLGYLPERITQQGYNWPLDMTVLLPQDPLLTQNAYWASH